jgi:hypothetical protein
MSKALGASLILPLCAGTFRVHFFPGVFEESLVSELSDGRNEPQAIQAAALTSECGNTSIFQPTEFGAQFTISRSLLEMLKHRCRRVPTL